MRKLLFLMMLFPLFAISQYNDQRSATTNSPTKPSTKPTKSSKSKLGIGLKAGVNFANVTSTSSIKSSNKTGYMFGAFMGSSSGSLISRRMELIYSKQGYDFATNTNTGTVDLDYILLPMLMGINIGKFALVQVGTQTAFLLNAKADTTSSQSGMDSYSSSIMQFQRRVKMGAAAGLEIYPYKGILIGARYNITFGETYKEPSPQMPAPSFLPKINAKNNVVQFFIGYRF